jgi:hypothetical protein
MSPWTLRSRLTVTRLVTVVCLVTILHGLLSHIQEVHTYSRQQWRDRDTERHNSGIVDFPPGIPPSRGRAPAYQPTSY